MVKYSLDYTFLREVVMSSKPLLQVLILHTLVQEGTRMNMSRKTIWTGLELLNKPTKVVLVSYPDSFRLDEGKSLVESSGTSTVDSCQIVKIFTQKYLNHSQYGLGSGKAEEIK